MKPKNRKIMRWNLAILVIIIILGLAPRAIEVLSGNYLFGFDQGLFFERVRNIVVDRKFTLIGEEVGGRGGFFQGPGFYYLLAIPFTLFGGDPYGGMVFMLLVGVGTMILASVLAYRVFGPQVAIAVTFLMAVSPAMVSQSRFIWNPFFVPLITITVLILFFDVLKKKANMLPWVFVAIGFMFHFEIATGIMMLVEFTLFSFVLIWRRVVKARHVVASLGAFMVTQLHFLVFDIRHDFLITKGIISTATGKAPHAITWVYIQHMFRNHWDVFKFNAYSIFPYGDKVWMLLLIVIPVVLYLIMKDKKTDRTLKEFLIYLILMPFVTFILYMKYMWPMWNWWILELGVVYIFLVGIISVWIWQRGGVWRLFLVGLASLFLFSHVQSTFEFYRIDYPDYGGTHKIRGKIDAIDAIYQDADGRPFNLFVYSPPIYTYPYDYLFWWHGKRRYGFVPGKEKQGIFYLLIEPDPTKPWGYKGWQETVIKTGTIVKNWTQPSGFIIEKRIGTQ